MKSRVFLSHSSKDKGVVRKFDRLLRAFGVDTFLDERDIDIGDDIVQRVYEGIDQSSHIICFISRNSVKSNWVKEELSVAKMSEISERGIKILPVLLEPVGELPPAIRSKRYADFCGQSPDIRSEAFLQILKSLGAVTSSEIERSLEMSKEVDIRSAIAQASIMSADLLTSLADICFLLRFPTEASDERLAEQRTTNAKDEIAYRQIPAKLEPLGSILVELEAVAVFSVLVHDVRTRMLSFHEAVADVLSLLPGHQPENQWLLNRVEVTRSFQRRLSQLLHRLLVFYVDSSVY